MTEVVGLFDSRMTAERAVDQLYSLGYDAESVGYLDRHTDEYSEATRDDSFAGSRADDTGDAGEEAAKGATGGAIGGAAVGAGTGLLASAGVLMIPGIGPFLAAGTLAGTLAATAAGGAGGAVVGGAAGAIFGAATDDETSAHYRDGVEQGRSLVTVNVLEGQEDEVTRLLRDAGADRVDTYAGDSWAY